MAGLADILGNNERAALAAGPAAGPVLYALVQAMRRGTDRWSEPDFQAWIEEGRRRGLEASAPTAPTDPREGTPKRG